MICCVGDYAAAWGCGREGGKAENPIEDFSRASPVGLVMKNQSMGRFEQVFAKTNERRGNKERVFLMRRWEDGWRRWVEKKEQDMTIWNETSEAPQMKGNRLIVSISSFFFPSSSSSMKNSHAPPTLPPQKFKSGIFWANGRGHREQRVVLSETAILLLQI